MHQRGKPKDAQVYNICYGLLFSAIAQTPPLNEIVNFKLPKGAERTFLSRTPLKKNDISSLNTSSSEENGSQCYKINNLLLCLNAARFETPRADYLESFKRGFDSMVDTGKPDGYKSFIKTFNGTKFLIVDNEHKGKTTYSFYAINNEKTSVFTGIIYFTSSDRVKTVQLLEEMFNSVHFK